MEKILPACPVETTLMLISDRWKVLIIRDLLDGTKRFGELKKSIGSISQKVLTSNLREMEADGLVKGLRGGASQSGVYAYGYRLQSEAHSGRDG